LSIQNNQSKNYGLILFKNYKKIIDEFEKITFHEQETTNFMENLLHYLFNGVFYKSKTSSMELEIEEEKEDEIS
jgi:hypothetical protein